MLQETLLAAWRGLDGFEGRASSRTWLYRIATNRCLNALRDRGRRMPPAPSPPFQPPEPSRHGDVRWLQDAWLSMPPAPHEYHGVVAIASFLRASAEWRAGRRLELGPTRANGQPAFTCSLDGEPTGVIVLTLSGDRVRGITRFLDGRLQEHFEAGRTPCRVD
ncbi:sigma factor [Microbispora sitophila]|uniref:sigma factor n=1 Tax=Microbispora sitophila TaxID=2771537 RepID=UPI00384B0175